MDKTIEIGMQVKVVAARKPKFNGIEGTVANIHPCNGPDGQKSFFVYVAREGEPTLSFWMNEVQVVQDEPLLSPRPTDPARQSRPLSPIEPIAD